MTIDDGLFEVVATSGDIHLGGEDFDNKIIEEIILIFQKRHNGVNIKKDPKALAKLKIEVEKAKRELSS